MARCHKYKLLVRQPVKVNTTIFKKIFPRYVLFSMKSLEDLGL